MTTQRGNDVHPVLALHREMNRIFDDVFRGFDRQPFGVFRSLSWPKIDIDETETDIRVTADLPGLEEKDVSLEIANGMLLISGEKKSETEDKARRFSERYYGRFERRIPLEGVEDDKRLGVVQQWRTEGDGAEIARIQGKSATHCN